MRLAFIFVWGVLCCSGVWASNQDWNVERALTAEGLEIWLLPRPESKTVAMDLVVLAGSRDELPSEHGSMQLLASVMASGAGNMNEREVKTLIEGLGGAWWCFGGQEAFRIGAHVPAQHTAKALAWIADLAFRPVLAQESVQAKSSLILERQSWRGLLDLLWFGSRMERMLDAKIHAGTGLEHDPSGDARSLSALTSARLQKLHRSLFQPSAMILVVVGPVSLEQILRAAPLYAGPGPQGPGGVQGRSPSHAAAGSARPRQRAEGPLDAPSLIVSRWPALTGRTSVTLGFVTEGAADPDRWALGVLRTLFSKKIFELLRNELGLVYSARASHEIYSDRGFFSLSAEGESENKLKMLEAMRLLLERHEKDGIPQKDFLAAKNQLLGAMLRQRDTTLGWMQSLSGQASLLPRQLEPKDRLLPDPVASLSSLSPEQAQAALGRLRLRTSYSAYSDPILTGQSVLVFLGIFGAGLCFFWILSTILKKRKRNQFHALPR